MALIRPRLTDYHGIHLPQSDVDFAIPFFDEDIPLSVDPFLLWKSPSHQDKALHLSLVNAFNHFGYLAKQGKAADAEQNLIAASECDEVGLGLSASRKGKRISKKQARQITALFTQIPQYSRQGFQHFEEIQLFVEGISKDRVSDFACSILKSFLIDFTIDQCEQLGLPIEDCSLQSVYDVGKNIFAGTTAKLPVHPHTKFPLIFVPKRWLRFTPWLDFDDYFTSYCPADDVVNPGEELTRVKVLNYNRDNYGVVETYVKEKERTFEDCKNDPLFKQIPVVSARRSMSAISKLPTGKTAGADRDYEEHAGRLLASLLYPHLDFAELQSRTDSGVSIRDAIFYNNRNHEFLKDLHDAYGCKQLVFELKNVKSIERDHINQLNRYMTEELGTFGVLVTRHELPKARLRNTIDLWSGQRRCIIALTDVDLAQMVEVFESKQRLPLDVIKKKYVQFRRQCPG